MATQGTPSSGLAELAKRTYFDGADLELVLYTNPFGSLGPLTAASDLRQPPLANGYQPIILTGVWDFTNGIVTYTHPGGGDPKFLPTGAWGPDPVNGAALVFGSLCIHFDDFLNAYIAVPGKSCPVSITDLVS